MLDPSPLNKDIAFDSYSRTFYPRHYTQQNRKKGTLIEPTWDGNIHCWES